VLGEVTLRAAARAADGTWVSDSRHYYARRPADLPSPDKLAAAATDLATSLTQVAAAGQVEEYTGPVLFTGEAAAVFFDRLLADKLADPALPVSANLRMGQAARADKLTGMLGRRILPAGFQAVDDPTKDALDGIPLFGGYPVDDEGVPAAPVTLVEDGQLKAFYMSRIPTKEIPASNGHGRRGLGSRVTGQPANLIVTASASSPDLKQKLEGLCKDEGLPYGLIVERFDASPGGGGFRRGFGGRGRGFGGAPADASDLPDAIAIRKLYPDGHEEAVRGGHIAGVTAHALRSIVAVGADRNVTTRHLTGLGPACVTVVAPSVIVTQLDVRPTEGGGEKPPLIPRPSLSAK
jgi:predicted Zn-dependent protease